MAFQNPGPEQIAALFESMRTIAVVGLSPNPARPSYGVSCAMQRFGYHIIPVRPAVSEVLGEKAYADLRQVPARVDCVNVFRRAEELIPIVDAAIAIGASILWIQEGIVNEAAALRAQAAGLTVVMDRCIYKDYMRSKAGT